MQLIHKSRPTKRKSIMPANNFFTRYSHFGFVLAGLLLVGGITLAGTSAQAKIDVQSKVDQNNPHHIPDELNPRFHRVQDDISSTKNEVSEEIASTTETIHAIAFKDRQIDSQPTYDYTTGTTN